jgi:indolepyruvate ferredoxin oxidoreductase beta subunit
MNYDIVLCGVGGQGVLSLAAAIAQAAMDSGLDVRQSEVHGMSQRGGAVVAHLRMSTARIKSDLVPKAMADMVLSMEPLESLRYVDYLKPDGVLVTASDPFINIPDYPDPEALYSAIRKLPRGELVDAGRMAKEAGNAKAVNMVLIGAASRYLPLKSEAIETAIRDGFAAKGDKVVAVNLAAFRAGREKGC